MCVGDDQNIQFVLQFEVGRVSLVVSHFPPRFDGGSDSPLRSQAVRARFVSDSAISKSWCSSFAKRHFSPRQFAVFDG